MLPFSKFGKMSVPFPDVSALCPEEVEDFQLSDDSVIQELV